MDEIKLLKSRLEKLEKSEKDFRLSLAEMKVRVVGEMIMNDPISDYYYLEHLENEIIKADKMLKKGDDENGYYSFTKKDSEKKLKEILSKKTKEQIYKEACQSYSNCCKYLYD